MYICLLFVIIIVLLYRLLFTVHCLGWNEHIDIDMVKYLHFWILSSLLFLFFFSLSFSLFFPLSPLLFSHNMTFTCIAQKPILGQFRQGQGSG